MDLARCQEILDDEGLTAFLSERQDEVEAAPGGMFDHLEYVRCDPGEVPDLIRVAVWVDPAVTSSDQSDSHGIQADGVAEDGTIYRLYSFEGRTTPVGAMRRALLKAHELGAAAVGVETDQGGDTWKSVFKEAWNGLVNDPNVPEIAWHSKRPAFRSDKAGAGHGPKAHRASRMLADYEKGRFVHVRGTHQTLERALNRFPKTKPFDLVDVAYWAWQDVGKPYVEIPDELVESFDVFSSERPKAKEDEGLDWGSLVANDDGW